MKKLKKIMAIVLTTLMLMSVASVAMFGSALDEKMTDQIILKLDDGTNPFVTNPPKGKNFKLKNFAKLAQYAGLGYNHGLKGPIIVTKGTLNRGSKKTPIYLVTLTGLELPTFTLQTTDVLTCGLAGEQLPNDFEKNVRKVMKEAIPKDANVVIVGHSLGGMVAQQVAANKSIQKRYHILNIVAYGSPVLFKGRIEGTMKRLGDVSDPVPYLSAETFKDFKVQNGTLQKEDSGIGFDVTFKAHRFSYIDEKTWGKYDVLGYKNGKATLSLNVNTQKFYSSQYMGLDQVIGQKK